MRALLLGCVAFLSLALGAGSGGLDVDGLVSLLQAREESLRQELWLEYDVTHQLLPGYAERVELRTAVLQELHRRGQSDKEPEYPKLRSDWQSFRLEKRQTLAIRGTSVRIDYEIPKDPDPRFSHPAAHHTDHFDGTLWRSFGSTDRHGGPVGIIQRGRPRGPLVGEALLPLGLALPEAFDQQFQREMTLGQFLGQCAAEGHLDVHVGTLPDTETPCYVAEGYVSHPRVAEGGPSVKVYVDPARGFVPLRIESGFSARNEAGEMLTHYGVRVISSELRQVGEALWVPIAAAVIHSRQERVPAQDSLDYSSAVLRKQVWPDC